MTTDATTQTGPSASSRTRYEGALTTDAWDQQDDEPRYGFTLARAEVAKTFSGALVGTSRAVLQLVGVDSGTRAYTGFEQFVGTLDGRAGTFVLRHAAEADATGAWMTWTVLPGSGTGELTGLRGEGQIDRHDDGSHTYWLELALG
jgi:Protein of unknown function (DUF3224)